MPLITKRTVHANRVHIADKLCKLLQQINQQSERAAVMYIRVNTKHYRCECENKMNTIN